VTNAYPPDPAGPPTQPVPPPTSSRVPVGLLLGVGLLVVVLCCGITIAGLYLGNVGPLKDSGLAMCEEMRDAQNSGNPLELDGSDGNRFRLTEAEYHDLRSRFADSRYDDIRDAGTRFADMNWQLNNLGGTNSVRDLMKLASQLLPAYSALADACANHDVILTAAEGR
jgi:hypothetical protein